MIVIVGDDNGDDDDDDDEDDADDDATMMMMMTRFVVLISLYICFKGGVRADWRCSGCVVMIIIMTVGDAEDAR